MTYVPAANRYERMLYRRCGQSGSKLPAISFGLWWNFGHERPLDTSRDRAPGVRPRHFPLRSREQLRAAVRFSGRELRPADAGRPGTIPRRARHLDEGW
jgi:hypothetical protein